MVALKSADIERFVARPDPARPIVLVYGPDAGLVHERVERLIKASVDDPHDPFAWCGSTATTSPANRRAWSRRPTRCRCSAAGARSG